MLPRSWTAFTHSPVQADVGTKKRSREKGKCNKHWRWSKCNSMCKERVHRGCWRTSRQVERRWRHATKSACTQSLFMIFLMQESRAVRDSSSWDGNPRWQYFIVLLCFHVSADLFPASSYYCQLKQLPPVLLECTHKNLCQLHRETPSTWSDLLSYYGEVSFIMNSLMHTQPSLVILTELMHSPALYPTITTICLTPTKTYTQPQTILTPKMFFEHLMTKMSKLLTWLPRWCTLFSPLFFHTFSIQYTILRLPDTTDTVSTFAVLTPIWPCSCLDFPKLFGISLSARLSPDLSLPLHGFSLWDYSDSELLDKWFEYWIWILDNVILDHSTKVQTNLSK